MSDKCEEVSMDLGHIERNIFNSRNIASNVCQVA